MKLILVKYLTVFAFQALFLSCCAFSDFGDNDLIENELDSRTSSLLERLIDETTNFDVDSKYVKRSTLFKPKLFEDSDEILLDNERFNEDYYSRLYSQLHGNGNRKRYFDKRGGSMDTDLCRSVVCTNTPINGQIAKTWKLVQQLACCRRRNNN